MHTTASSTTSMCPQRCCQQAGFLQFIVPAEVVNKLVGMHKVVQDVTHAGPEHIARRPSFDKCSWSLSASSTASQLASTLC
jgi:hypothetical protein